MKILFICENYIPHYGGAEVVFKNLAEGYVKLGHEVTILTHQLKNTKKREIINGVKVIRVPSLNSRYLFSDLYNDPTGKLIPGEQNCLSSLPYGKKSTI